MRPLTFTHRRLALSAALATALLVSACGGDDGSATDTADDSTGAVEETATEDSAAGAEDTAGSGDAGDDVTSDAAAAGGDAVQIDYLHRLPDGEGMTAVTDIVARWNEENPTSRSAPPSSTAPRRR